PPHVHGLPLQDTHAPPPQISLAEQAAQATPCEPQAAGSVPGLQLVPFQQPSQQAPARQVPLGQLTSAQGSRLGPMGGAASGGGCVKVRQVPASPAAANSSKRRPDAQATSG